VNKEKKFLKNLEIKTNFLTFVGYIKNIPLKREEKKEKKFLKNLENKINFHTFVEYMKNIL